MKNVATTATTRVFIELRTWLFASALIAASVSCSSGDSSPGTPTSTCRAASTSSCRAASGCRGVRICQNDGTWSSCDCTSDPNTPLLGNPCADDTACPGGAFCLLPTSAQWLGGGPPQGLCVADCSTNVDLCKAYSGAACVSSQQAETETQRRALCMPTCNLNLGTKTDFACSSVPSSACEALVNGKGAEGYCRPFCIFDSECSTGHCDRQFGVCIAEAPAATLLPFGSTCTSASQCDGTCLLLNSHGAKVCTNRCVYGFADEYGKDIKECGTQGAPPFAGVCLYATSAAVYGNLGYCTPLCNCDDECATGFVCRAFSTENDAGTAAALGHKGMCVPALDGNGVAALGTPCGA